MIEKQLNASNKWFKVATLDPTVTRYCVENLKEKSEYFFKIYAENCIGLSQPVETKLVSLLTHASKYACGIVEGGLRLTKSVAYDNKKM